ncbi:MAG: hypothetical protein WDN69_08155 [Aliidongia sp.]
MLLLARSAKSAAWLARSIP